VDAVSGRWAIGLLGLLLACATAVQTEVLGPDGERLLDRIAVAVPTLEFPPADNGDASKLVVAQLLRALQDSGRHPISPAELGAVLQAEGTSARTASPEAQARVAERVFGAHALLLVRIHRFVPRVGGERGVVRPASVRFELDLRAPDGSSRWRGEYNEAQKGLTEDLLSLRRALSRRFRWVRAEELAAYGARELVSRMPREI
jgi:hypothetical protein